MLYAARRDCPGRATPRPQMTISVLPLSPLPYLTLITQLLRLACT